MRNLLVEMAFNGSRYHGFQVQKNAYTVTEAVQDAIERVFGRREPIVGCSRTDTGVHANQYFFHMKTELAITPEHFVRTMNDHLPADIVFKSCREVPLSFHARYGCVAKEYVYLIDNGPIRDPFRGDLALYYRRPLDEGFLEEAAQCLTGRHDFSAFCSRGGKAGPNVLSTPDALESPEKQKKTANIRTVEYIRLAREGETVRLSIKADGYLYNMVRIIVGTLLYVGEGKISAASLPQILAATDRARAGKKSPAQGLYLNRVWYPGPEGEEASLV